MFIDTHAHLTHGTLAEKCDDLVSAALLANVEKIVNICTDETSLRLGLELAERFPVVYNTASTTPHDVEEDGEHFFPFVEKAASDGKLVAIGETGLDYYYEHSNREVQKKYLRKYLDLAKKWNLPVVIHCRDAFEDLFKICDEIYRDLPLVLHCFTGSLEEAKEVVKRGWHLSLSGIVTFKKSEDLREVARFVPLDQLLIETDSPYLAPMPHRGKENQPAYVVHTAACIAQEKGLDLIQVAEQTKNNASRFFSFE